MTVTYFGDISDLLSLVTVVQEKDIYLHLKSKSDILNPFCATGLFLYPLKALENLWFLDVFRWYRNKTAT